MFKIKPSEDSFRSTYNAQCTAGDERDDSVAASDSRAEQSSELSCSIMAHVRVKSVPRHLVIHPPWFCTDDVRYGAGLLCFFLFFSIAPPTHSLAWNIQQSATSITIKMVTVMSALCCDRD